MTRNPFRRGVAVPADVVASTSLHDGEKVLAGTQANGQVWLLGTREALHVVGPSSELRIPWERVERADWNRDDERLVVAEVGEFGRVQPRHTFRVTEPGVLLELVRERVTSSVVVQRWVPASGQKGLRVIGRRAPSGDGQIAWVYQFDAGVDPDDPAVMAAAEEGLRAAQADIGL